jgi:hypothetical protein
MLKNNSLMKLIAWLVVVVPLAWGVTQSVKNSIPLFTNPVAEQPATGR